MSQLHGSVEELRRQFRLWFLSREFVYLSETEIEREFGSSVRALRLFMHFVTVFIILLGQKYFAQVRGEKIAGHKATDTNNLATLWLALLSLTACGGDFVAVSSQPEQAGFIRKISSNG